MELRLRVFLLRLGLLTCAGWSFAAQGAECEQWVARLVSAEGLVEWRASGQTQWQATTPQILLCPADTLRTGAQGRAAVQLQDHTLVRLNAGTTVTFAAPDADGRSWLDLLKGAAYFISRVTRRLTVTTPFVNAGVEGTEFLVGANDNKGWVAVYEGRVRADNPTGNMLLTSDQRAEAVKGEAPVLQLVARPRDTVQWTIYYPPIIQFDGTELTQPGATPWMSGLARAIDLSRAGQLTEAFAALNAIPVQDIKDARFHTYRASLNLAVGQIDAARTDLDQALTLNPKAGEALALQAIIAVVQNDSDRALTLAQAAVAATPDSASAYIALSYAHQAQFDLELTRTTAEKALTVAPNNPYAWARVAEVRLMFRDISGARHAAERAVALDPHMAHGQTVLGYAALLAIDTSAALGAFERAIELDPAAPLPRLGLGLARIRNGELKTGRRDIEIATLLDPGNALVRSYLGKAYFEERRNPLAGDQYALAKEADPRDPTPWLYEALRLQSLNRPVEALSELQTATDLNDNRAVYRSRLLLDADSAARSTDQARTYTDLGFTDLAQQQAARSLTLDPANSAAHRLLADGYAGRPRLEVARASELLQSQLLQPLTLSPVQPQLAETNLNLLGTGSPVAAAYQEYTSLFVRDDLQLTAALGLGDHATFTDELVLAGLTKRYAFSLGQFHYETDGFRDNADVQHDIYNVYWQASMAPGLDVQFEYRGRDTTQGDLRQNFAVEDFLRDFNRTLEQDIARIGIHYNPVMGQDVLLSVAYAKVDTGFDTQDPVIGYEADFSLKNEGHDIQLQYLRRDMYVRTILGGGMHEVREQTRLRQMLDAGFGLIPLPDEESRTTHYQTNAYVYSAFNLPQPLSWTLGLSYDGMDDGTLNIDEINPKLGLQWDLTPKVRLRAAGFRTTKRLFAMSQTLEPTAIAGFNQFYDDANGSTSEVIGVGLDTTPRTGLSLGAEAQQRDIDVRYSSVGTVVSRDQLEHRYHGYFHSALGSAWAVGLEWESERIQNVETTIDTQVLPLTLRYFHPQGWRPALALTGVRQHFNSPFNTVTASTSTFAVVDATLYYRLPRRRGAIGLEVNNLLDRQFRYEDLNLFNFDPFSSNPRFLPERTLLLRATVNL